MVKKIVVTIMLVITVLVIPANTYADSGRIIKSLIFPGMGQLGDEQNVRGLSYMTGEVLLLTMFFSQWSNRESSSRETYVLTIRYDKANTFEEKNRQFSNWQDAFNKYNNTQMSMALYAGGALLLWGWNVADAVLFAPAAPVEESSLYKTVKENLALSASLNQTKISYTIPF